MKNKSMKAIYFKRHVIRPEVSYVVTSVDAVGNETYSGQTHSISEAKKLIKRILQEAGRKRS